jgi:hypothetical protein
MGENEHPEFLPRVDWVRRAAARIRQRDDVMLLSDAADLASALWRRPNLRETAPELAVDQVFDGDADASARKALLGLPAGDDA